MTNQRLLVLQVLAENKDRHLTAEDIYELVKEDYPEILQMAKVIVDTLSMEAMVNV